MNKSFSLMTLPGEMKTKKDIYRCLKNWIIYSDLKPGEPIKERSLSSLFQISRTPLREILQLLSYQHLVVIKPQKGVFVAPIDTTLIKAVFETRLPLEKQAVALAATRRSTAEIRDLETLLEELQIALGHQDIKHFIRLDQRFHEITGQMTQNPVMAHSLEALHNPCLRYWFIHRKLFDSYEDTFRDLTSIARAIKDRDPQMASHHNHIHVSGFLTLIRRMDPAS